MSGTIFPEQFPKREWVMIDLHALRTAISNAKRTVAALYPFNSGQAARIIRIEIDHAGYDGLRDVIRDYSMGIEAFPSMRTLGSSKWTEGPGRIDGVDLYVVDQLPDPHWRVINPMEGTR